MTNHHHSKAPRHEHVMLELGEGIGALVLYVEPDLHGEEIEITPSSRAEERSHKQVHKRLLGDRALYAAVFDRLQAGDYTLWLNGTPLQTGISVTGARVTELDWRRTPQPEEAHT